MAWLAVDKDGNECIYSYIPIRAISFPIWVSHYNEEHFIKLTKGTIEKLIGRKLTWSDEPVELTENNNNK